MARPVDKVYGFYREERAESLADKFVPSFVVAVCDGVWVVSVFGEAVLTFAPSRSTEARGSWAGEIMR